MAESTGPTLTEAIEAVVKTALNQINTCLPGEIRKFDVDTAKADVKPLIQRKFADDTVQELPVITNVPVVFPRTKTGGLTFPLTAGDGCLIVFSQRSLERWSGTGVDSEPGDTRKFDLSDAICIPGLFAFTASNIASNNSDLEITNKGQKITLKANGDIEIGTESLKKLVTEDFVSMFNDHQHNYPDITPAGIGVTSKPCGAAGTLPPPVGVLPAPPLPGVAMGAGELTDKTSAQ